MKEALVRYSEQRIGSQAAQVRAPIAKDDRGNVTDWRVYPMRSWSDARREMWLPMREARLWDQQRDWSVVETRTVEGGDEEKGNGEMVEGLVRYIGRRRGKFGQRVEKYPTRSWSLLEERWLPITEAELWDRQKDWRIVKRRTLADEMPTEAVVLAAPAPPAERVDVLLDRATQMVERLEQAREEEAEGEIEPVFCLSESGLVHRVGCRHWPKHPPQTFETFADAVHADGYARPHRCCQDEMVEEVEASVVQMNSLSESYGIQATEA